MIRLWEEPAETFLHGGLGVLPLALLGRTGDQKVETLREVIREIDERLQKESEPAHAELLMTAAYVLAALRADDDELRKIFSGGVIMPKLPLWDEMELKGQVKQIHRELLRNGRQRLGIPDQAIETALLEIRDLDRLERMADAIWSATSWQDVLATP